MPAVSVSMVCESTAANVTAALRESLGSSNIGSGGGGGGNGGNTSCSVAAANAVATGSAADAAAATGISSAALNGSNGHGSTEYDEDDSLHSKLVASAKRVLLSKVDYEEVDNYGQSVLDTLKSKYILLKPNAAPNFNNNNNNNSTNVNSGSLTNGSTGVSSGNGCSTTENGRLSSQSQSPITCANNNNGNSSYTTGSNGRNYNNFNVTSLHNGGVNGNSAADCNGSAVVVQTATATATATTATTTSISKNALTSSSSTSSSTSSSSSSNCFSSSMPANTSSNTTPTATAQRRLNSHELPSPKRILFPRENVRIGWKNGTRKWQIGVGMMNVGNTCYLNSTLQALFHVPSMANWLASETAHMERCDDGADAGCIICAMCKTLLMAQSHLSPIRPYSVYSKLRIICKHLIMGRQEDAHEFLRYLVEAMEKSYLSRFTNYKELDQYSKETTPLNQILGGYLKSAVRCLSCNHVSVTFQHFQDLLLDIRKADTVEEALDAYFSRERLEDMGYKCESCKKKVSATKQFTLERAPIALCIQLKRFSMMGSKLNKQIVIRPRLDLSKYLTRKNPNESYTYKLVSMITHLGASQHCGHYTAIGLTESGAYYNFDDSCVRPISVQGVCNTNAYIIFYEMDSTSSKSATTTLQQNTSAASPVTATVSHGMMNMKENNGFHSKNGFSLSLKNNIHNNNNNNIESNDNSSLTTLTTPQRLIGPQLPPGGLLTYSSPTSSSSCNGIKLKNVISNCAASSTVTTTTSSSSISTANNNSHPNGGGNSKILIHFKDGRSTTTTATTATITNSVNNSSSINTTATATPTTTTTTTTSLNSSIASLCATNLTNGIDRHCESPSPPPLQLAQPASPLVKVSLLNENSCSSEPEDGVSSTTDGFSECTVLEVETTTSSLPSMPNLFDDDEKSKDSPILRAAFCDNSNSNSNRSNRSNSNKAASAASLVPYDLESDDELFNFPPTRPGSPCSPLAPSDKIDRSINYSNNNNIKNLKRSGSSLHLDNINENDNNDDINIDFLKSKRSNSSLGSPRNIDLNRISPNLMNQSKTKQKTENPIDEIFSSNQNQQQSLKLKSSSQCKSPSSTTATATTTTQLTLSINDDRPSSPINIDYKDNCIGDGEKYEPSSITPPYTPYAQSSSYAMTPPSPPLIQTKTGIWQVTSLNATDSTNTTTEERDINHTTTTTTTNQKLYNESLSSSVPTTTSTKSSPIPPSPSPKKWINPFAAKAATEAAKPSSATQNSRTPQSVGNGGGGGYRSSTMASESGDRGSSNVASELLQHSHRGYGAPVLTWNGDQTDIEKELKNELHEQRLQDLEDEEQNEMDRGRQKKVKLQHNSIKDSIFERTPGYNPFQEQDNQRCRWKSNNTNGNINNNNNNNGNGNNNNCNNQYRYYNNNNSYRQQPYQRNKPKFQRYNNNNYNKYQRPQQQQQSNGGGGNGYSSNNNNSGNNYSGRRET